MNAGRAVAVFLWGFWGLTGCGPLSEPIEAFPNQHSLLRARHPMRSARARAGHPPRTRRRLPAQERHGGPTAGRVPRLDLFSATDGTGGEELWRSDGTAAGTQLVKDLAPGALSSKIAQLTPAPGGLFFSASDGSSGQELWWSDGTVRMGPDGLRMWPRVKAVPLPTELTVVGERLFFMADDGTHGSELWMHHRVAGSTALVKEICPGPLGASGTELDRLGQPASVLGQ